MITIESELPREVNTKRAAALLYGDLGTSKAYVLGLSFALAGYSSFWFILAVSLLTCFVGLNYIQICKLYPNGGGVYTSAKSRSKVLALIGGFFLISDYVITAAISAVSAFHYLGVSYPEYWAIFCIALIGLFNLVGAKQSGNLSLFLSIPTVLTMVILSLICLPFLPKAIHQLTPISGNFKADWNVFVGIIVALSGIESIANMTGSMKLDEGSTPSNASVSKTSTRAILLVILEVCTLTTLLALAMNALSGLEIVGDDVNAPNYPNVRDAMLRYMAQIFGGTLFGPFFGHLFSLVVTMVITLLLLSAVNTALIALTSLLFIMSKDKEMPDIFQKLNSFGVPIYPAVIGFILPILVLIFVSDIQGLANLYAIGFVGAIAVNLGVTSTNSKLSLTGGSRLFMFSTFVVMFFVELTLFIDKPHARLFVLSVLGVGFFVRALAQETREKMEEQLPIKTEVSEPRLEPWTKITEEKEASLIAVVGINNSIVFALEEAKKERTALYILFIREQRFVTPQDQSRSWIKDKDAKEVYEYVRGLNPKVPLEFLYTVSSDSAKSIVQISKMKKVKRVIIGRKRKYSLLHYLRGTSVSKIGKLLPDAIDLVVVI